MLLLAAGSLSLGGQSVESASVNRRVALVIGNSDYDIGPLLNPENDARAMAAALRQTNFEVLEYIDLQSQADMKRAIREFGRKIQDGGVGLFYYAGHGIQVNGKNYLIPIKAQIYAEEEVEYESVDVGFVLTQMEIARNRMNIIILDACRNNPFARSWRSAATGLAFINAPTGTLIAYSTAPGSVASDGTGANGLYTEVLLRQIRRKGLKIEDVFKNVRSEVLEKSNDMQTPWESSSLVGDFYFVRPDAEITETRLEELRPQTLETGEQMEWKRSSDNTYFLYRNAANVSGNTSGVRVNDDLLVYDLAAGRNYLLEDFYNTTPGQAGTPVELKSECNAFWMRNEQNWFWFYLEGKEVTGQTNNAYYGSNLVVYHKPAGRYYALYDYTNAEPGKLYPAFYVYSPNNTLWWADEKYYYLYVDGIQMASRTWAYYQGNDLIVHDEEGSSSYRFRDYYNNMNQRLSPAEILFRPGMITCTRGTDNTYYTYRENKPYYMPGGAAYSDQDLLVYDTTFQQVLVFNNFLNTPPDTHITGRPVFSRTGAVWKRKEGTYYLYIRGVLQTENMVTARYSLNNSDLEVTETATGIVWLLEDYARRNDNTLRPAALKQ